jgi:hypothetical protein
MKSHGMSLIVVCHFAISDKTARAASAEARSFDANLRIFSTPSGGIQTLISIKPDARFFASDARTISAFVLVINYLARRDRKRKIFRNYRRPAAAPGVDRPFRHSATEHNGIHLPAARFGPPCGLPEHPNVPPEHALYCTFGIKSDRRRRD